MHDPGPDLPIILFPPELSAIQARLRSDFACLLFHSRRPPTSHSALHHVYICKLHQDASSLFASTLDVRLGSNV